MAAHPRLVRRCDEKRYSRPGSLVLSVDTRILFVQLLPKIATQEASRSVYAGRCTSIDECEVENLRVTDVVLSAKSAAVTQTLTHRSKFINLNGRETTGSELPLTTDICLTSDLFSEGIVDLISL